MKVRSITDVITNSSTEVWAIKTHILEEARSLFRDEAWREKAFEREKKENFYDFFIDFPNFQSLLEAWETPEGEAAISNHIPQELRYLFKPHKLSFTEVRVLRVFGHSKEEVKAFEDRLNTERLTKLQEKEEDFKEYLGWSVAVFYDHFRMWGGTEAGKKLITWLKENHNPDDWNYDY